MQQQSADHHQIPLHITGFHCLTIILLGEKKSGSDDTSKKSNTKSKEHEPDQLQEAEQVHLVISCFTLDTCPNHVLDTLYLWLT